MLTIVCITFLMASSLFHGILSLKQCENCLCDCTWTEQYPCATSSNDGTCCYNCCCDTDDCSGLWEQCGGLNWDGSICCSEGTCRVLNEWYHQCRNDGRGTSATTYPTLAPSIKPTSSCTCDYPDEIPEYCPLASDLRGDTVFDQGWSFINSYGASTLASFNLLGGYVEYDLDVSGVNQGVNTNVYTISPAWFPDSGYTTSYYCDAQRAGNGWCVEIDFVESNGDCGGETTLHTRENTGNGCCHLSYLYDNKQFHMRVEFALDGSPTIFVDGVKYDTEALSPLSSDIQSIRVAYEERGAVIYSSQWVGWVPLTESCGGNGNVQGSRYSVTNLKIRGTVVRGPTPNLC